VISQKTGDMGKMNKAVLTTDIKESSKLTWSELKIVNARLEREFENQQEEEVVEYFELFRGDSAQAIVRKPSEALSAAFRIKTGINRIAPKEDKGKRGQLVVRDIRIAVGVGTVTDETRTGMTNEEPFVYSGRELENITGKGLSVGVMTPDERINRELATELFLYEGVMRQWTLSAAEVVYHKLLGKTERVIAEELSISQSAVNQHSRAAYWNGLDRLIERYRELTEEYDDYS